MAAGEADRDRPRPAKREVPVPRGRHHPGHRHRAGLGGGAVHPGRPLPDRRGRLADPRHLRAGPLAAVVRRQGPAAHPGPDQRHLRTAQPRDRVRRHRDASAGCSARSASSSSSWRSGPSSRSRSPPRASRSPSAPWRTGCGTRAGCSSPRSWCCSRCSGSTMGFSVETLGFYALFIPLMAALGYDRLVTASMIIIGALIGVMGATVNPFSIGVAAGEAGVSIGDGIVLRLHPVGRPDRDGGRLGAAVRREDPQGPERVAGGLGRPRRGGGLGHRPHGRGPRARGSRRRAPADAAPRSGCSRSRSSPSG